MDWICREYLMPTNKSPAKSNGHQKRGTIPGTSVGLPNRAEAYVDNCDAATTGDRNNAAFKLAGHLWAMTGDNDERMDEGIVWECVQTWNSRNPEPLGEDELRKAMLSARDNGTARPDKHSERPLPTVDDGVGIDDIMLRANGEPSTPPLPSFDSLGIEVPGLIGDIIKHNLSTAFYPLDELAMASAISLMSVITGGKVQYRRGRSNLYSIGLAPTGAGKDHGRKINREILRLAGCSFIAGPERIGSHAGLITAMARNWRTLFQVDEIGFLVRAMKNGKHSPHLENIAAVLMQLYSSADSIWTGDAYGDANKVKTLEFPHAVLYGTSVPQGFWDGITPDQMENGLMGRMLVFENVDHVEYCDAPDLDIPQGIIDRARSMARNDNAQRGSGRFGRSQSRQNHGD